MNVKIDTKEKFHVITVPGPVLSADMAVNISKTLAALLGQPVRNIILNMKDITVIEPEAGEILATLQQQFYEQNASFVVCEMSQEVEQQLDQVSLLELLNNTPTESEAWDIVQMEEIERELLDGENT
jgi:anti-anti-sigma factor